jgi:peptide/nickel transport system substrate-binding protein
LALWLGVVVAAGLLPSTTAAAGDSAGPTAATWAEPAGTAPDYIFPFAGPGLLTVANAERFWDLMYRPLYWFDTPNAGAPDPRRSLAAPPVYSDGGRTVTITLKPYRWSDGEAVSAADVMFWMNMLHAEKENWGGYQPGGDSIPDDVTGVTVSGPDTVTMSLDAPYAARWFSDDQLSQITPLPLAWDRTSASARPGSGGCAEGLYGTVDNQCAAVFTFLSEQAGYDPTDPSGPNRAERTYAANPLWQVVDGPWRLERFSAGGRATFVPNRAYSGPDRPTLRRFTEVPFASDPAELAALAGGRVDVGYLPQEDVTTPTADPWRAGPNGPGLGGYTLTPLYAWAIDFVPYNFDSTGDGGQAGAIFRQAYFRQAFQRLVDQKAAIATVAHGYGVPTAGPVPAAGPAEAAPNPYPYSPSAARALLAANGWVVAPGATTTCARAGTAAGDCGQGIATGAKLSFTLLYADGVALLRQTLEAEQADWSRAGIDVRLVAAPSGRVAASAAPCPKGCGWELADWGGGWLFDPGPYPSGEQLFATGAAGNAGGYSDATADADIAATLRSPGALPAYQRYLARALPVVYQPRYATALVEVRDGLDGVTPQSPLLQLTPEDWRWAGG